MSISGAMALASLIRRSVAARVFFALVETNLASRAKVAPTTAYAAEPRGRRHDRAVQDCS